MCCSATHTASRRDKGKTDSHEPPYNLSEETRVEYTPMNLLKPIRSDRGRIDHHEPPYNLAEETGVE